MAALVQSLQFLTTPTLATCSDDPQAISRLEWRKRPSRWNRGHLGLGCAAGDVAFSASLLGTS